jgi:lysophospholipase L1-like esterase
MFERMSTQKILLPDMSNKLFNFSVGGDGVEHLKCRMEIAHRTYFAQTPTFVLLIGINNVMGAVDRGNESKSIASTPTQVAEAISNVVRYILENSIMNRAPMMPKVYLCKLLYVLGSETLDAHVINHKVDQVNALLENIIPQQFPSCQLVHTVMAVEPCNYEKDGLHLSKSGYTKLMAQLPDFVQCHAADYHSC